MSKIKTENIAALFNKLEDKEQTLQIVSVKQAGTTTKRTFKIDDGLWDSFLILVAVAGRQQAEYINLILKQEILANSELIEQYRRLRGKK